MTMNDKYEEVLKQYALQVRGVRRGRGAWIYETDQGMKSLKEYQKQGRKLGQHFRRRDTVCLKGLVRGSGMQLKGWKRGLRSLILHCPSSRKTSENRGFKGVEHGFDPAAPGCGGYGAP